MRTKNVDGRTRVVPVLDPQTDVDKEVISMIVKKFLIIQMNDQKENNYDWSTHTCNTALEVGPADDNGEVIVIEKNTNESGNIDILERHFMVIFKSLELLLVNEVDKT